MNDIAIYTLTSELHDEQAVNAATREFLNSLNTDFTFHGSDYSDYGQHALNLIYVRTGGTECVLKPLLPAILAATPQPLYLLTSGKSNSLAASMEILSYLQQHDIHGEIIHGSAEYIHNRIAILAEVERAKRQLRGKRLGVIGRPSDWLISSNADYEAVAERLGMHIIDIPMKEVKAVYDATPDSDDDAILHGAANDAATPIYNKVSTAMPGAMRIYHAIKAVAERHNLDGLTIRCFDLLTAVHNTGCIALAKLNSEGIIAGCEGDVPAMLSMAITQAVTGVSGFQANPARINPETGELLFAHCTIPLNMLQRYELDTHFESGEGIGIRGYMREGDVTIFKVSGDLSRHFVAEATLVCSQGEPDLCRTQQVLQLDAPEQARYFLTSPIGNHHIIMPGHHKAILDAIMA